MSDTSTLTVPLAEAAPVLKTLKGRKSPARIEHRAFVSTLLDFMRRDPDKVYLPGEIKGYMQAQLKVGDSCIARHIGMMIDTKAVRRISSGKHSKYMLARRGDAPAAPRPAKAVKAIKVTRAAAPAIDNDEALLNQFLAVLVQMEGWAQRQKKRDAHYRKLLAMLKEVE
jgi:hypothetical protein